jgi:hypothetical protein
MISSWQVTSQSTVISNNFVEYGINPETILYTTLHVDEKCVISQRLPRSVISSRL